MTPLQEDKQPNKKMGKELEQTLLQGGYTEDPETYEMMLSFFMAVFISAFLSV